MPIVRNVKIKDATKDVATGLSGNVEAKLLDIEATKAVADKFKKGAFYSATDGHANWKIAYTGFDGSIAHFHIM